MHKDAKSLTSKIPHGQMHLSGLFDSHFTLLMSAWNTIYVFDFDGGMGVVPIEI